MIARTQRPIAAVALIVLLAVIALLVPSAAAAYNCFPHVHCQAAHYWQTSNSPSNYKGTAVTVGNGIGSEQNVVNPDFALSSAYADAGPTVNSLIQQGVAWRNHVPYPGQGDCVSNTLQYYVEVIHAGAKECWTEGAANFGEQHVQEVLKGSGGNWRPYLDGVWKNQVQTTWNPCGGDACTIAAFAEEQIGATGTTWHAKYAGSGNVPWEFWNGSAWNTINNCSTTLDPGWNGSGPFPGGMWSFIYNDGGTNPYPC